MLAERRLISAAEYERMSALGFFEGEKLELIRGTIVHMHPKGAPHVTITRRLTMMLARALDDGRELQAQSTFAAGESRPEPDLAIVSPTVELPRAADVIIEVAETSFQYDTTTKAELYAEVGILEYWVVSLPSREIWVHTEPRRDRYATLRRFGPGEVADSDKTPCPVDVDALFKGL